MKTFGNISYLCLFILCCGALGANNTADPASVTTESASSTVVTLHNGPTDATTAVVLAAGEHCSGKGCGPGLVCHEDICKQRNGTACSSAAQNFCQNGTTCKIDRCVFDDRTLNGACKGNETCSGAFVQCNSDQKMCTCQSGYVADIDVWICKKAGQGNGGSATTIATVLVFVAVYVSSCVL